MPYEYRKLKGRIVELYGTRKEFAKALEVCEMTVSKKLSCKIEFTQSDIERWAELLKIERCEFVEYFFT